MEETVKCTSQQFYLVINSIFWHNCHVFFFMFSSFSLEISVFLLFQIILFLGQTSFLYSPLKLKSLSKVTTYLQYPLRLLYILFQILKKKMDQNQNCKLNQTHLKIRFIAHLLLQTTAHLF